MTVRVLLDTDIGSDIDDAVTGSGQVVTHTYAAVGVYTATVTASNALNELTAETVVTVVAENVVYRVTLPLVYKNYFPALAPDSGLLPGRNDHLTW